REASTPIIIPERRVRPITEVLFLPTIGMLRPLTILGLLRRTQEEQVQPITGRLLRAGQTITLQRTAHQAERVGVAVLALRAEAQEDLPVAAPVDPEEEGEINFPFFF